MKKILILGAGGLLGKEIQNYYTDNSQFELFAPSHTDLDITNIQSVTQVIALTQPDIVINCAAIKDVNVCEGDPYKAWEINMFAVGFLLQAIAHHVPKASFVHISSADIFGSEEKSYIESDTPYPISVYGWTKVASEKFIEQVASKAGIRHFIIRTAWLYGSHKKSFIDTIIESLLIKKSITVASDQYDTPVWTYELVKALDQIMHNDNPSGIYHCVPNVETRHSRYEIAHYIASVMNLDPSYLEPVLRAQIFQAKRPPSSILINTKTDIFNMPDWKESLQKFIHTKYQTK